MKKILKMRSSDKIGAKSVKADNDNQKNDEKERNMHLLRPLIAILALQAALDELRLAGNDNDNTTCPEA
jgi:hypothetical protein